VTRPVDDAALLAFRVAGQGLAARSGEPLDVLRGWAVQDSPPGAGMAALLARARDVPARWLEDALADRTVVALYNARTATALLPADEVAAYATALLPDDDAGLKAIAGPALPDRREGFAEPVATAVAGIADALDGVVLSRDDLHAALRRRLPAELLPWCPRCESHHARRGLLVMAALHGRLCLTGRQSRQSRQSRQPAFARTDQWVAWAPPAGEATGAALVRRYLSAYGPSTPAHFAQWAGLGRAHARALWARAEAELHAVGEAGWVRAEDAARLAHPPAAEGIRLAPPGDPLLLGRDRERLIPDPGLRKRLWTAIATNGLVLAAGAPAGLWRARKVGKRLAVTVEPFGDLPRAPVQAEAERLAPARGCDTAAVDYA